jgi:hypothetical protein
VVCEWERVSVLSFHRVWSTVFVTSSPHSTINILVFNQLNSHGETVQGGMSSTAAERIYVIFNS